MDMWTTGYLNPILEANQDIKNAEGKVEDGVTTIKFTRARDTGDSGQVHIKITFKSQKVIKNCMYNFKNFQDVAFTDDKGLYMIFPVKGGRFNGVNKKIRKHEETPSVSSERIFIKSCRTADGQFTDEHY